MNEERLSKLIASIYEGVFEAEYPRALLSEIASEFGSSVSAVMEQAPVLGQAHPVRQVGLSDGALREYQVHYAKRSILLKESVAYKNLGQIFCDHMIPDYMRYEKSEAYQEFFEPNDAKHLMQTHIEIEEDWVTAMVLRRPASVGHYIPEDQRRFSLLIPHFINAARHARAFRQELRIRGTINTALETLNVGVIVLDARNNIVFNNASAEEQFRQARMIRRRGRKLAALRDEDDKRLQRMLADVRRPKSCRAPTSRSLVAIRDAVTGDGGFVSGMPMTTKVADRIGVSEACLMVFVTEPRDRVPSERLLQRLYGLTKSEAAVTLALYRGRTVAEIAEARGTGRDAVRYHLKSVFQKLNVTRQSEIVRKLSRGPMFR